MKNLFRVKLVFICAILISLQGQVLNAQTTEDSQNIKGTWINEETPEWKWVISSDGKCYDYYKGSLETTYTFTLETTSPQCGQEVPTGEFFLYLKLVDVSDISEVYCYEIASLSDQYLQIRYLPRSKFMLFKKQ